jgi:hypothetical protein
VHKEYVIHHIASLGALDGLTSRVEEEEDRHPELYARTNRKATHWTFYDSADKNAVAIGRITTGTISCRWHGTYIQQGFTPMNKRYGQGKSDFIIEATHYRRDQLNVVMWESPKDEPILGDYLLRWMKQYWRDGVVNLMEKGLPSPSPPPDRARGNPVARETVRKYHELAQTTTHSANAIQDNLNTTTDSYYQYCKMYTGKPPVDMADRAQKIKQGKWPPAE